MTDVSNEQIATPIAWRWVPVVLIPAIAGILTMFVIPGWMVGFDATSYLAEVSAIAEFGTYSAPDGSAVTFRGPGYPLWLTVGWFLGGDSAEMAIFTSRVAALLLTVVAASIVFVATRRAVPAVVAGLVVAAQPFVVLGGSSDFFPDGVAVLLVVLSVALLVAARSRPEPFVLVTCSGIVAALALMTKESHVLILSAVVLWVFTLPDPLRRRFEIVGVYGFAFAAALLPWMVYGMAHTGALPGVLAPYDGVQGWLLLALMFLVPTGFVVGGRFLVDVRWRLAGWVPAVAGAGVILWITTRFRGGSYWLEIPGSIWDRISIESFRGMTWLAFGALLLVGGIALWCIRSQELGGLIGAVAAGGVALLVFTGFAATSPRNAILLPVAVAVAVGLALGSVAAKHWVSIVVYALGVVIVVGGVVAIQRIDEVWDFDRLTYESDATTEAAAWIEQHHPDASFAGTPAAFQSIWRLGIDHERVALTPVLVNQLINTSPADPTFSQIYGWIGKPFVATRGDTALMYSYNRKEVSAMFTDDVNEMLVTWDYLVLAGNTRYPALPTDGGILALALADADVVDPVFVSHYANAQWVAVVRPRGSIPEIAGPIARFMSVPEVGGPYDQTYDLAGYAHGVEALLEEWQRSLGQ